jgi:hypothetical protein
MCEGCKWEEEKLKLTLLKKNYFGGKGHMDSNTVDFGSGEGVNPIEPWLLEHLPTTSSNKVLTSINKQI